MWREEGTGSERGMWFYAILWTTWIHRNHVVFHGLNPNPYQIMRMAEELVCEEFRKVSDEKKGNSSMRSEGKVAWGELKFIYGSHHGRQCIIAVDGA